MTNGEKIQTILDVDRDCIEVHGENETMTFTVTQNFWNAEYKEPTTKNDLGVDTNKLLADCEKMSFDIEIFNKPLKVVALDAVKNIVNDMPSVTPQEPFINKPCVSEKVCEHDKQMVLDKIKAEIKALSPEPTAEDVIDGNPIKDAVWETLADVLQIIDKYKAESEDNKMGGGKTDV